MTTDGADAIVVGAGLAGLVAAAELADAGRRVLLLDQEGEANLGGQAFWSFGGLFLVDSPEQRRLRVRDSRDLAWQDWVNTAGFDRAEDHWPRRWAEAYVDFAAGEKGPWLRGMGVQFFPVVGWAERGGALAGGPGNSVPRFHITWGTGPGVVAPFEWRVRAHALAGRIQLRFRHRVTGLSVTNGVVDGVHGEVLEPDGAARGERSSRVVVGEFAFGAGAVIVTSGGIGGNHDLVRRVWPTERLGPAPSFMVSGVPAHVDGAMQGVAERAGGHVINPDRMWHYTEGLRNHTPIWANHGIRILPGPSSLWLDPSGQRLPAPLFPGFDTLGTLAHITRQGFAHTWFLLNERIIEKEFALSGSEQNPDLTGRDVRGVLARALPGVGAPVRAFMERGPDFVVRDDLRALVRGMNDLIGDEAVQYEVVEREVRARDAQLINGFGKDAQLAAIRSARAYLGDRLVRVAKPHALLDPAAGPLIAVKLNILTRKSLGGLETDLQGRVLRAGGAVLPGLYAAGEVAGFGGGGMHGYRALEGTFLGGCLFSGRVAGRAAAAAVS
ncbi:FAD-binding dehydrogenase [Deinococcus maricopensis]|uniref:Fumarate reductase/succinate dehydrogenase flavoprotein domain protein n=1 Tax=Deinococcus maricopensis (strain DSM 21211 / LMG 22137 / NRRL B-23946 / LB-34) TaxID=709986 RepID=E8U714_DEIML|nr:FAD-binding dehydrogenase [Deinococcus maricopensis]ADV66853.1 fumarate reductase/succinate dehydrogenase flavoprotein domain protein [Deinococcus maricopensis DSM 21211]